MLFEMLHTTRNYKYRTKSIINTIICKYLEYYLLDFSSDSTFKFDTKLMKILLDSLLNELEYLSKDNILAKST